MINKLIFTLVLLLSLLSVFNGIVFSEELEALLKKAEEGDAEAQYNIGVINDKGEDVSQNYHKAIEWYKKALEIDPEFANQSILRFEEPNNDFKLKIIK